MQQLSSSISPLHPSPARSTGSTAQSVNNARLHHLAKTFDAAVSEPLTSYKNFLLWKAELQQVCDNARTSGLVESYADIIPLLGKKQFGGPFVDWIIENRRRYLHLGDSALEVCLRDFEKENFINVDQRIQKTQLMHREKPSNITFAAFLREIERLAKSLPLGTSLTTMELKEILFRSRPAGHIPTIVIGNTPTHWTKDEVTPSMFAMFLDAAATEDTGINGLLQQVVQRLGSLEKTYRSDRAARRPGRDSSHSVDEDYDEAHATAETPRPPGYPSNPGYPSAPRAPSPGRAPTGCYICGSTKHGYKLCPYQGLLAGLNDEEMENAREVLKKHFRK
ncbi:hypothetical protein HK102_012093 [Quaeritorhiza haematococci]|nr:hypothetical protein HK102_012093 [Quaeritorhiza haematococci]